MERARIRSLIPRVVGMLFVLALAGCSTSGPPTMGERASVANPSARTINVLYVTDRAQVTSPDGAISYGTKRSKVMRFGEVVLREESRTGPGGQPALGVERVSEAGAFPTTPYAMDVLPGAVRRAPAALAAHDRAAAALRAEVSQSLAKAPRKEVVFFIHGYANDFDDSVETTGSLCRALRDFVCVVLTWPAGGSGGAFFGYNIDRESGEFAVADMKKAIRIIATTPGVQKVHFIGHSRGTDVLASALQQLSIEAYASGASFAQRYKVENIVLFAADIDLDVATTKLFGFGSDPDLQRVAGYDPAAPLRQGSFQLTVYSSPKDRALGISGRIFGSQARLGQLSLTKRAAARPFAQANGAQLAEWIDFIEYTGNAGWIGHSYFVSDPAVKADLVALIRDGLKAGDPGRPLVEIRRPFWRLIETPGGAPVATATGQAAPG